MELPAINFPYLGTRGFTGVIMLTHIFFATLFVGFAMASPVLEAWGARTGSPRMERLAHSITRFNVLTFSTGATFAVAFLVLLVGFYPRVATALFIGFFFPTLIALIAMVLTLWTIYVYYYKWDRWSVLNKRKHIFFGVAAGFFIWFWMVIMSGIDSYMLVGVGANGQALQTGQVTGLTEALNGIFNPMFIPYVLHRTFGNLSWPAFAVAAWAAFRYGRVKSAEDKAFYDWTSSMGVMWGTAFLMLQPIGGFAIAYALKISQPSQPAIAGATGSYERLTTGPTSNLLLINTIMVVGMFVLANLAMYFGASRLPEDGSRRSIRVFGLIATLTGLYAISPFAMFPVFYMRYIMMGIMILATVGTIVTYVRGRRRFRYGASGGGYRWTLMALGVLTAVLTLNMGLMKSNSRAPYTIYNQPQYQVTNEAPPGHVQQQLGK